MADRVTVGVLPRCDFCSAVAAYDAKTTAGPWANLCELCWLTHGVGKLGTGYGQRLVLRDSESGGGAVMPMRTGCRCGADEHQRWGMFWFGIIAGAAVVAPLLRLAYGLGVFWLVGEP